MGDFTAALRSAMNGQIEAYSRLGDLLKLEHTALRDLDRAALDRCGALRAPLLAEIEQLDREFATLLGPKRNDTPALQLVLERVPSSCHADINHQWQALKEVAERCQMQNEVNGKIIARNRQDVEHIAQIFFRALNGGTTTYAQNGRIAESRTSSTNVTA